MEINYYEVLGINNDANIEQINSSFRKLALKYHPDHNKEPNAEEMFIKILEAYEILKEPSKRKVYNEILNKSKNKYQGYTPNNNENEKENNFHNWQNTAREEGKKYSKASYEEFKKKY
jgi:DnaJ-class molecular chaperone